MNWGPEQLAQLEAATHLALAGGHRLLQTHRLSPDDRVQVEILLDWLAPPVGGVVLDAGCGFGEVSRIMSELRPDLQFILANICTLQLAHCPSGPQFRPALMHCEHMNLPDASVDAVMFHSALMQMDARAALAETARVLKPGGVVTLFELAHSGGQADHFEAATTARIYTLGEWTALGKRTGLVPSGCLLPDADDTHFRKMLRAAHSEHVMRGVFPMLMRFSKVNPWPTAATTGSPA
jgi:ubiquinone/menaquinone biosynthesis C-methylase UbiE